MAKKYFECWQSRKKGVKDAKKEITKKQYDLIMKDMNAYSEKHYGKDKHEPGALPQFSVEVVG